MKFLSSSFSKRRDTIWFTTWFLLSGVGSPLLAASNHWVGASCQAPAAGSCDWSDDLNWAPPVPPPSDPTTVPLKDGTADITFGGAAGVTPNMNDNWNVNSLMFDPTANAFTLFGGSRQLTIQGGGIQNNSLNVQVVGQPNNGFHLIVPVSQTWAANLGPLSFPSPTDIQINAGANLTLSGPTNISIGRFLLGSGGLIKSGTGTVILGGLSNPNFTGSVTVNQGVLQLEGVGIIKATSRITLNGGTLVLNRQNAVGSTSAPVIFNGGKLQAIAPNSIVNPSDFYGTLVISNNSSSIDFAPTDTNGTLAVNSTLTFNGGSRTGTGTLTINGWTGTAGMSGTDDRLFITNAVTADFLNAIQFTGFPAGAVRLSSGEIVPPGPVSAEPVLSMPMQLSSSQFKFTVNGPAGQNYAIQSSENLTNWATIATTNPPGNTFNFVDPNATNSQGFYRVIVNP